MLVWLAIIILIMIAILVYSIVTAPEGYEDENGFHYGKPDDGDKEDT